MTNEISDVKRQVVNELHKPARRNFRRRITTIKGFADLWQIDLAELQPYAKSNEGYRYILVVIDCYSKYLWTVAVKDKTGSTVTNAMKHVLKEAKYSPKHIQSDQGKEFFNKSFSSLMREYNINHYSTFSTKKAAIAERVIRTIKAWLYKEFSMRGHHKWLDILPIITSRYNNKVHRTIGMAPINVDSTTKLKFKGINGIGGRQSKPKFQLNDIVRISKYKHIFEKSYTANFTTELFKIVKINKTIPTTYNLEDMNEQPIRGCFYEEELLRTENPDVYLIEKVLKRRKNKVYVKWLGLPSEQNSWIDESNMV